MRTATIASYLPVSAVSFPWRFEKLEFFEQLMISLASANGGLIEWGEGSCILNSFVLHMHT